MANPVLDPTLSASPATPQEVYAFNTQFVGMLEHFDPFLLDWSKENPRVFHDRIPRKAYTLGSGTNHQRYVFRGGLPHQGGLKHWANISMNPSVASGSTAENNPCAPITPLTYSVAYEKFTWEGKRAAWESAPICLDHVKYVDDYSTQIAWQMESGVQFGASILESWNREIYLLQAVNAGRAFIMTADCENFGSDAAYRFIYDPFTYRADPADGIEKPYIKFRADKELGRLNFATLDYLRQSLGARAGSGALTRLDGRAEFGVMLDLLDVEDAIKEDGELRQDWRWAAPKALIADYPVEFTNFRGWAYMADVLQMRFKIGEYSAATDADLGGPVFYGYRVYPLKEGRIGEGGFAIPEDNAAYWRAEVAIALVFMDQVFINEMVPGINSVGSGTHFGPFPGLNGKWSWLNIPDKVTNPFQKIGNFYGEFEIFPQPLRNSTEVAAFLYRRCKQSLTKLCGIDVATGTEGDVGDYVLIKAAGAAGDYDADTDILTITLNYPLACAPGTPVLVKTDTAGGTTYTGIVVETTNAPTYRVALTSQAQPANGAAFTATAAMKLV
jgi:hypothetical protein